MLATLHPRHYPVPGPRCCRDACGAATCDYGKDACRAAATALGKSSSEDADSNCGSSFSGNYNFKGCYIYTDPSSQYYTCAFYGLVGGQDVDAASVTTMAPTPAPTPIRRDARRLPPCPLWPQPTVPCHTLSHAPPPGQAGSTAGGCSRLP